MLDASLPHCKVRLLMRERWLVIVIAPEIASNLRTGGRAGASARRSYAGSRCLR